MKEQGIDRLFYAVTSLAGKNAAFKAQMAKRVAWLYVEMVPLAERKQVDGEQTTIRYRAFLFEGYDGALTQAEIEEKLPGIVAGMPDMAAAEPGAR